MPTPLTSFPPHVQVYPHPVSFPVEPFHPPLRPNFGRIGKAIMLRANHFQVKIPKNVLYHYDVTIVPEKCPRRINREIVEELVNNHSEYFGQHRPVFDGRKYLYSRLPLPIGRDKVGMGALGLAVLDLRFECV